MLAPSEQSAVSAWLASNPLPRTCARPRSAPRPHEGAPVRRLGVGALVSRELQHAATAGALRLELPVGCVLADDGHVRRAGAKRRGRKSKGASA